MNLSSQLRNESICWSRLQDKPRPWLDDERIPRCEAAMDDGGKNAEPDFLSSFVEYNEAKALLNNLLSVSLVAEPTLEENKSESQRLNRLAQIVACPP